MIKRQHQALIAVTVFTLISISSSANAQLFGWFRQRQQEPPAPRQQQQQQYPPTYYYQGQAPDYYSYSYNNPQEQPAAQPQQKQSSRKAASSQASRATAKAASNESVDGWMSDWNAAFQKAKRLGRPIVLIFVHEGCPECDKLDATLTRADAAATLENAVKVKVEFSNSAELVHRYGIQFTPTFMVFAPGSTTESYREVGALSVDRLQSIKPSIDSLVTSAK